MKEYYSIGEMAGLNFISVEALRYYDRIGLLKPSLVNEENGYRYYTYRDFLFLDKIQYLKNFGMSLAEIKYQLSISDMENSLNIYEKQLAAVNTEIRGLLNLRKRIRHNLRNLSSQNQLRMKTEAEIIRYPERYMVTIDKDVSSEAEYEITIRPLSHRLYSNNFIGMADFMGIKLIEDLRKGVFGHAVKIGTIMEKPVPGFRTTRIPGGSFACIYHPGNMEQISESYLKLLEFIDDSEYSTGTTAIEIHLIDQMVSRLPEEHLTHIQIPLVQEP